MIDQIPFFLIGCVIGFIVGAVLTCAARRDKILATASENELLSEVKRRRTNKAIAEKIDKEVEQEAQPSKLPPGPPLPPRPPGLRMG